MRHTIHMLGTALAALALALAPAPVRAGQTPSTVHVSYLYPLASPAGMLPSSAATLAYDRKHGELYVVADGLVRVFNGSGMEIYTWPQDEALGPVVGVAPLDDGDVIAIRHRGARRELVRCNYRGEPQGPATFAGIPEVLSQTFQPSHLAAVGGRLYLADLGNARTVLVVDLATGTLERQIDLAKAFELEDRQADYSVDGFSVDEQGNILATVAPAFKVFILAPDGTARSFGRSGSAPGKFSIVKGVGADDQGHIYVADVLKSAVMVFDREFKFLGEFGYRGNRPGNLLSPRDVVVAGGRLYVSQQAKRGVAVFQLSFDQ
jgi:DNA-binding beta-propeller fold protein YncE